MNASMRMSALLVLAHASFAAITGTVVTPDNTPVAGAVVYAVTPDKPLTVFNNVVVGGERVTRALTGKDGRFQLDGPASALLAQDIEDACGVASVDASGGDVTIVVQPPANAEVQMDTSLDEGEKLLVQFAENVPVRYVITPRTRDDGTIRLASLMPGQYKFLTVHDVPQVGCCFRNVVTRQVDAKLAPGASETVRISGFDLPTVEGRILDSTGAPLHGVWVRLIPKSPVNEIDVLGKEATQRLPVVWSAVTRRDGSYSIGDVLPGNYTLRAFRRLGSNSGIHTLEAEQELVVASSQTDLRLAHSADMSIDLAPFQPLGIGDEAPEIAARDLNGNEISLASLRGKTVVLHFFASWCVACVNDIGTYDTLQAQPGADDLVVIGISLDESEEDCRKFVAEKNIQHPVIYAGSWASNPIRKDYRVAAIPYSVVIGQDGVVVQSDLHGAVLAKYIAGSVRERK